MNTLLLKEASLTLNDVQAIDPDDYLCYSCYMTHQTIVKSTHSKTSDPEELKHLMETWQCTLKRENVDAVTKSILHAVLFVANEFLHERAVLLPCACRQFLDAYKKLVDKDKGYELEIDETSTVQFTSRWLLNQLQWRI